MSLKILLFPNLSKDSELLKTKSICEYLLKKGAELFLSDQMCPDVSIPDGVVLWDENEKCDIIIALGGDGTILRASQIAYKNNIPILGINLGKIGYMADVELSSVTLLDKLFSSDYTVEERMMMCCTVCNDGVSEEFYALNDFVIANGSLSKMLKLSLNCDKNSVFSYNCDGIIISTPTGSTAYSMSAGGSIVDPRIECILMTPICPHSLGSKPMIFSSQSELEIINENKSKKLVYLTVDGNQNVLLSEGASVMIKRAEKKLGLIKLTDRTFTEILSEKMKKRSI